MKQYVLILLLLGGIVYAQDEAPAAPAAEEKPASAEAAPAAATAKAPEPAKKPPRVRSGYIAKAEFTSEKPSSEGESRLGKESSSAWAVITLDLDPGRAVSVFDYVLSKDGTEYPCLDMAENNDTFSGMLRNYSSMNQRKCRLVFAVPSAEAEYEMVFKLTDDSNRVKLNAKAPPEPAAQSAENKSESADAGKSEEKGGSGKSDSDGGSDNSNE